MTVVQAITEVLHQAGTPLSAAEIYRAIQEKNLFVFRASNPLHVVQTQLRRHSAGAPSPVRAKATLFECLDNGKYVALRRPHPNGQLV